MWLTRLILTISTNEQISNVSCPSNQNFSVTHKEEDRRSIPSPRLDFTPLHKPGATIHQLGDDNSLTVRPHEIGRVLPVVVDEATIGEIDRALLRVFGL